MGVPGNSVGMWPAHWMMPNDSSCWPDHGEIDIMEMINGDGSSHATYHWNKKFPKIVQVMTIILNYHHQNRFRIEYFS